MKARNKKKFNVFAMLIFIVLVAYTLLFVSLLLWAFFTSLKTKADFRTNVLLWPKRGWQWSNYSYVFENFKIPVTDEQGVEHTIGMFGQLINSVIYALGGAFLATLVPCVTAYVTAKFDKISSKVIYTIVIVTMTLPIVGAYPSEIHLARTLGIYDQIWGIVIMKGNFLGMYYLVFFAAFKSLNKAYYEAAYLDGASEWRIMVNIAIPLVKTAFSTIMLIKFIEFWNDYQTPLLYAPSHPTLAYGVWYMSNNREVVGMNNAIMRVTSSMILLIPILIVFILLRKKLMGNITVGGIKG